MKTLGIIPARYGSSRFPGKPLALIHGKSMIERVFRRASGASLVNSLVVATDDQRIYDHVTAFGGKVVMTSSSHESGTDRCAEVIQQMDEHYDFIINIQGDEPYIHPQQIDVVIRCLYTGNTQIATLIKKIITEDELNNPNIPKVVVDQNGFALYFSRHPIPYCPANQKLNLLQEGIFFKHIGIYGYSNAVLPALSKLPRSIAEKAESLEQLRWLENGYRIITATTTNDNLAVDTPDDIEKIESFFDKNE